jgi:hypothetical protein
MHSSSMGRASALYSKWVCGPKGALSIECQELNALYSDSVDGAPIRIPDRLSNPPRFANSNLKEELILKAGELIKTINEADTAATTDTHRYLFQNLNFSTSSEKFAPSGTWIYNNSFLT